MGVVPEARGGLPAARCQRGADAQSRLPQMDGYSRAATLHSRARLLGQAHESAEAMATLVGRDGCTTISTAAVALGSGRAR